MITQEQIPAVLDHPVHDAEGNKIGDAKHVFLDEVTGQPEWVSVKTGLFGTSESFVPICEATMVEDHLEVPYAKDTVKDAPNVDVDAGAHLSEDEEHRLYEHYGIAWDEAWQQANQPGGGWAHTSPRPSTDTTSDGTALDYDDTTASGIARSGKEHVNTTATQSDYDDTTASGIARSGKEHVNTTATQSDYDDTTTSGIARSGKEHVNTTATQSDYDDTTTSGIARSGKENVDTPSAGSKSSPDDEAMTHSAEQMHLGTERRETGRPRLRKYVITEEQQ
ncbi:photosystem reaction center subunit H [Streptomyces sp. NBC_00500]|uniref:photosystem reaction center subunit H n=1 Tax=unclassified Streptomyces TaxID=2593676 RepID=UPI0038643ED3